MRLFFYLYYYLLANGLVLLCISFFRIKKNPATKYYLLQYLVLLILVTELVLTEYVFRRFYFYCYSDFPVRFLLTPFIYLYVCTYTNPQYKPSKKILAILFLPAVAELLCFLGISIYYTAHIHSFEERLIIANTSYYYIIRTFLALLFNIGCVYFAYSKLRMFSWNIFKVLSNFKKLNFIWLKVILAISVFLWVYWLIIFFCEVFFMNQVPVMYMYNVLYLFIALVVIIFGYFAVLKPYVSEAYIKASKEIELSKAANQDDATIFVADTTVPNPENASLQNEPVIESYLYKNYYELLEKYMETTTRFQNPDITLLDISKELQTTSFNISKAIKIHSGRGSFYEYINYYRLSYFLMLLAKPESEQFTINTLALQSGFSSSTTLNKYCKKITGATPARAKILLAAGKTVNDLLSN